MLPKAHAALPDYQTRWREKIAEAGLGVITGVCLVDHGGDMASEEGVRCPGCGRTVVPRLLLKGERNPIAYRKAEHLCPYCGAVMYETGGGVNWWAVLILLAVFGACALVLALTFIPRR